VSPVIKKRIAFLTFLILSACGLAAAQRQGSATQPRPQQQQQQQSKEQNADVAPETADLAITAHVTARELRFETVPDVNVEFTGQPKRETEWDAVRENLPRPVQPGVTYRDIGVRLKIVSVFADIDRIVAEALGEVPVSDALPAEKNSSPAQDKSQQQPSPAPAQGTSPNQPGARPH
jgi:Flp pilus assembly protein CpaB